MQNKFDLKNAKVPKFLSDLTHSNQFLKMFSFMALSLAAACLIIIAAQLTKEPLVLTLNTNAQNVDQVQLPKPEVEIEQAVRHYIQMRYQWTPENVRQNLSAAQSMIHPSAMKAYLAAAGNVAKFSLDRQVSQRIYANKVDVDLEKKVAVVTGDRITSIQNLKAAGDLKLELSIEFGARNRENPWGIYVTKEREN